MLAVTTSTGEVRLVRLSLTTFDVIASQKLPIANTLECWCVSLSPPIPDTEGAQNTVVYAGGDDSGLRYTSLSPALDGDGEPTLADVPYPSVAMKNDHGAGVTAILPLSLHLNDGSRLVITGCYDESLRVFAIQDPQTTFGVKRTKLLVDHSLGGGVWRLAVIKIHEVGQVGDGWTIRLLASCMHAGTRIVDLSILRDGTASAEVVYRFEEHKSMNYGSDWMPSGSLGSINVASTSFYDRLLCLWEV